MVHTDIIINDLEFNYEGVLNFKDFLKFVKDFFKSYNYDFNEKIYGTRGSDLKTTKMKWVLEKYIDDYNNAKITIKIGLSDYKECYVDGEKVADGKLGIKIRGEMERDYQEKWKKAPAKKFLRAVYDKYAASGKQSKVDNKVKDMVDHLIKDMKRYLKS